jgi:hypothetical protein
MNSALAAEGGFCVIGDFFHKLFSRSVKISETWASTPEQWFSMA